MLFGVLPLAAQEALGTNFATAVAAANPTVMGCSSNDVAECLRGAPVASLIANQGVINTSPTSGVPTLPLGLDQAFTSGEFNRVPVLQGTNLNEGRLFEPLFFDTPPFFPVAFTFVPGGPAEFLLGPPANLPYAEEVSIISGATGGTATTLAGLYPPADFPNPDFGNAPSADEALGQIFTDLIFSCNGLSANQLLSKFVPVYAYEFADPNAPDLFQPLVGFSYGASHASELQYLFDPTTLQGAADAAANKLSPAPDASVQPPPLTPGGTELAAEMKLYWSNFVSNHTPNPSPFIFVFDRDDVAFWPLFNATNEIQDLVPGPTLPHPFSAATFSSDHNCVALGLQP